LTVHTDAIVVTIKIPNADLIGGSRGGGATDVCPARQTPSRCHWLFLGYLCSSDIITDQLIYVSDMPLL